MDLLRIYRVTSIILSHFILDIRHNADEPTTSTSNISTLEFMQQMDDGLGGPLSRTWRNDMNEDWEENESPESSGLPQILLTEQHDPESMESARQGPTSCSPGAELP